MATVKEINKEKDIFTEAENEIAEEFIIAAKRKYKKKLYERTQALRILANVERELGELKLEIKHDLGE